MRVSAAIAYINIKAEDGVLLSGALEARHFGLELVLGLRFLRAVPVVALRLLMPLLALRLVVLLLLLRGLAILPLVLRLGSRRIAVFRGRVRSAVRVVVAHVAIVVRVLSVGRCLRWKRRRGDVVGGRLAKARPAVLRRRCPRIATCWVIRIVRGVVHGGDSDSNTASDVDALASCLGWVALYCCPVERLGSLVHDGESASSLHSHVAPRRTSAPSTPSVEFG